MVETDRRSARVPGEPTVAIPWGIGPIGRRAPRAGRPVGSRGRMAAQGSGMPLLLWPSCAIPTRPRTGGATVVGYGGYTKVGRPAGPLGRDGRRL